MTTARPCSQQDHDRLKSSLEAFMRGTAGFFYELDGALHGDCPNCKSSLAIELEETK